MKLVILAGGSGSRLWPLSKKNSPKQLQPIVGDLTLLQKTFYRLRNKFALSDIFIATGEDQVSIIKQQIPELIDSQLIVEPMRRDTAAAIGLAAFTLDKLFPNEVMININSDHYIKDEPKYLETIEVVEKLINTNPEQGVLIGVNPTYPETGYGYIKMGDEIKTVDNFKIFTIDQFKEKPDLATAHEYVEKWEYLWNIGCFAWRTDTLIKLYEKHLPEMTENLRNIQAVIGTDKYAEVLTDQFAKIAPISMDYGIVEKATDLVVIPTDFGWADIGHWSTVKDVLSEVEGQNVTKGEVVEVNSKNNLAYSYTGKLIALVGVENLLIVENGDTILVCQKDHAQDVKKIVDKLKAQNLEKYV